MCQNGVATRRAFGESGSMEALQAIASIPGHPADFVCTHYEFLSGCKSSLLSLFSPLCLRIQYIETDWDGRIGVLSFGGLFVHYLFYPQDSSIKCVAGRLTKKRRVSPFLKISLKGNSLPCLVLGSQRLLFRKTFLTSSSHSTLWSELIPLEVEKSTSWQKAQERMK